MKFICIQLNFFFVSSVLSFGSTGEADSVRLDDIGSILANATRTFSSSDLDYKFNNSAGLETFIKTALNNSSSVNKVAEICGARFCPGISTNVNPNLTPPDPAKIQMLSGIFLVCMAVAVLLVIFGVDSLKR